MLAQSPAPSEIERATAAIRATWSEEEAARRQSFMIDDLTEAVFGFDVLYSRDQGRSG
jgi:hypothetical protein